MAAYRVVEEEEEGYYSCFPYSQSEFEFLNTDHHMSLVSWSSPDRSTGYLEDAVVDWIDERKDFAGEVDMLSLQENFWDWNNFYGFGFNPLAAPSDYPSITTADWDNSIGSQNEFSLKNTIAAGSGEEEEPSKNSTTGMVMVDHAGKRKEEEEEEERGKEEEEEEKGEVDVVYPFAVVKPGGAEGDVTLDEINRRMRRRPTRPIRHPVGKLGSAPAAAAAAAAARWSGISGKAVVGLVRVHTRGRGMITIIRTRG